MLRLGFLSPTVKNRTVHVGDTGDSVRSHVMPNLRLYFTLRELTVFISVGSSTPSATTCRDVNC